MIAVPSRCIEQLEANHVESGVRLAEHGYAKFDFSKIRGEWLVRLLLCAESRSLHFPTNSGSCWSSRTSLYAGGGFFLTRMR